MDDLQTIGDTWTCLSKFPVQRETLFETFAHAPISTMESCRTTGGGEHTCTGLWTTRGVHGTGSECFKTLGRRNVLPGHCCTGPVCPKLVVWHCQYNGILRHVAHFSYHLLGVRARENRPSAPPMAIWQ